MFASDYLNKLYKECVGKNPNEPEFLQVVRIFLQSVDSLLPAMPQIETSGALERMLEPERTIIFRVPWVDDNGRVRVNRGFRVQYNGAVGPYKGGLRFDETMNLSVAKFLAFEQTLKNALTGLPLGGAKGGADFSPKGKSDGEVMRFCQSFISELYRHIGAGVDVPAGDLGVGPREIGYLFGYYKKLVNRFEGAFTGKSASYGGSLGRPEATGHGLCYFAEEMLREFRGESLAGKRVVVSGFGQVGFHAARKAAELGAKVVALSELWGVIYSPAGLDIGIVQQLKAKNEPLEAYLKEDGGASFLTPPSAIFRLPCDVALPCATQNELDLESAKALVAGGVRMVCEGANMPSTPEAIEYFLEHGVLFGPGKAANAGGVAVSCLEMTQNATFLPWTFEEVDAKLKEIMKNIFRRSRDAAIRLGKPENLLAGASVAGFLKIYEAMRAQGVV
ncbi:MAG: NADP-specific glutamate dehydrogenase [Bacilli bacterium]